MAPDCAVPNTAALALVDTNTLPPAVGVLLTVTPDTVTCTIWLPATAAATATTICVLPTNVQDAAAEPLTVAEEGFAVEKKPEG